MWAIENMLYNNTYMGIAHSRAFFNRFFAVSVARLLHTTFINTLTDFFFSFKNNDCY